jgi:hydrogenase nickel incorporation protein HypB
MHRTKVKVVEEALDANNTIAAANRADFDRAGVKVVNFMSAPGAGKTSLLERVVRDLPGVRLGVLEGDVQGSMDADRLATLHVPVTQLNTDPGFGGECHLDANMVRSAIPELPLDELDLLVIENVGNLVCPAEFRVGEDARVMVCSITEGEDKPLKYPLMFRTCELVLVNKLDLLAHLDFDLERLLYNIDQVHPDVERIVLSARTGEGIEAWRQWHDRHGAGRRPGRAPASVPGEQDGSERDLLRRAGRAARATVPFDGRAVRPRRPSDRTWPLRGGEIRRAPRGRRVRPPGDRRQARAAGDRARGGGRRSRRAARPHRPVR